MTVAYVITDLTTDEARRRADGEMVLSVTTMQASPEYARNLTDRIRVGLEGTWLVVVEAYQTRAHAALGYASWDDYCTQEFGTSRLRLPREDRVEAVISLRDMGFSIRAIASAVGADSKTVQKDLQSGVGNSHTSPDTKPPPPVTGTDGKTYTPKPPVAKPESTPDPPKADPPPKPRRQKPVLAGDALAKDDAETTCENFGFALGALESLTVPEARTRMHAAWKLGALGATPHNRELHTPETIRRLAVALVTYATEMDEMERTNA